MILLCFSYLLAHTVVSKVRGLLNLIICKSWGCCNSFPAKQGFTIVIYSKTSMYHIYMCTSGHTYHTHVFVSQIHSALTLAQMAQMASSHSTQCLIMRKVWQWESSMHTPGCTCTCKTWIPPETGLIPLICPLAFHGSNFPSFYTWTNEPLRPQGPFSCWYRPLALSHSHSFQLLTFRPTETHLSWKLKVIREQTRLCWQQAMTRCMQNS